MRDERKDTTLSSVVHSSYLCFIHSFLCPFLIPSFLGLYLNPKYLFIISSAFFPLLSFSCLSFLLTLPSSPFCLANFLSFKPFLSFFVCLFIYSFIYFIYLFIIIYLFFCLFCLFLFVYLLCTMHLVFLIPDISKSF